MVGLARADTARLEEGNFKGAVRLLASDDGPASPTLETLRALNDKHPPTPTDRRSVPPPDPTLPQISFHETAVRKAFSRSLLVHRVVLTALLRSISRTWSLLKGRIARYFWPSLPWSTLSWQGMFQMRLGRTYSGGEANCAIQEGWGDSPNRCRAGSATFGIQAGMQICHIDALRIALTYSTRSGSIRGSRSSCARSATLRRTPSA